MGKMGKERMKQGLKWMVAALMFMALAGGPALAAPAGQTVLQSRSKAGGTGELILAADPLKTMTAIPMRLTLTDREGNRVIGTAVRCNLTMPAMRMPENSPVMTADGEGYRGEAIFTMAGAWRATFTVHLPPGEPDEISFDMARVLLK